MTVANQAVERVGEAPQAESYVRFNSWQRVQHWLLAGCFVALAITGLPQKYDDAGLSVSIINALGGIDNVRFLHRVLACVLMFQAVLHLIEIGLSILRRRFRPSMMITFQDFRDAFDMVRYSVGLIPDKPKLGRYDYRQKFEYWGIVFGAIIMIATGLVLWFPTYVTRMFPGELVAASKEMHSGEALLALLVVVVWHFYDVILNPAVFPIDTSMFTGKISSERLQDEHPQEYSSLVGGEAPSFASPQDVPSGAPAARSPDRLTAESQAIGQAVTNAADAAAAPQARWTGVMRRSLQWRVLILVTIGIAGILAAFSVSSLLAVNESIDRTLDERQALAEASAGHVDYVVRQGLRVLEEATVIEGFDLEDSDLQPEERALHRTLSGSIFTRVYLTDADGTVLWTEPSYLWMLGETIGSYPHVEAAMESERPSVSGLSAAVADGKPAVSMVAPIRGSSGQLTGLIAGDIVLSDTDLTDMIRPAAVGETGYTQILDNQGIVLASTRPGQILETSDHEGQVAALIKEKRASSGTCHGCRESAGGAERETEVMAFAPLAAAPWGVVIRQSEGEALAPANRLRDRAIWLGVPAFVLALLFAWATVRSVTRPVGALTESAQRIASGDLSKPVPNLGRDEIGRLGRAFETMRVRLRESLERIQSWGKDLEARVAERTQELQTSRDHLSQVAQENVALYEELKRKEAIRTELLKKVIGAQEEERRRIARELHDETSQALTALVVGMDTATLGRETDSAKLEKNLANLKQLAVRTLEGVHGLILDLRPSILDDLGLVASLQWYAENRLEPTGVSFQLEVSGDDRRLPAEVETALFRIGQEALFNVAKHARASNVVLSVEFEQNAVAVEVEDDGEGFDPAIAEEPPAGPVGWGILGMRERTSLLGGTLEIISHPGAGTRVRATIPLEAEE